MFRTMKLLFIAFFMTSCARDQGRTCSTKDGLLGNVDEMFLRLAVDVPVFGGLYLDQGAPAVWLTDLSAAVSAQPFVEKLLAELQLPIGPIQFKQGQYTWPALAGYRNVMSGASGLRVTSVDTNEGLNRVLLGVANLSVEPQLLDYARTHGVPEGAVVVEVMPVAELRDGCR